LDFEGECVVNFRNYFRSKRSLALAFVSVSVLAAVGAVACSNSGNAAGPYGGAVTSTPAGSMSSPGAYPTAATAANPTATPAAQAATPGTKPAAPAAPRPTVSAGAPLAIRTAQGGVGAFLTGPSGKTLYVFTRDAKNMSNCNADCVATWPPLLVNDGQSIQGDAAATGTFGHISTPSGQQVTYNGAPLYYFSGDAKPGDTKGHNLKGVWFVARPDTASTAVLGVRGSGASAELVGPNGMTLYFFAKDAAGMSNCSGQCLENWPALTVPADLKPTAADGIEGALSSFTRADDGTHQLTYNGRPLYFFAGDSLPGDTHGDGIGGVWSIARP
jgi:predicted lipoprotein with Yx(FWY)xxD motif